MRAGMVLLGLAVSLGASVAQAEPRPYRGPHPLDLDGHWHLEDDVHVHDELPVGEQGFAEVDGVLLFLADPVGYGYDGTTWTYDGAHPLGSLGEGYCGIGGTHRHPFSPEGAYRRQRDGSYSFVGAMRGGVSTHRPERVEAPRKVRRERAPARPAVTPYGWPAWRAVRPGRGRGARARPRRHGGRADGRRGERGADARPPDGPRRGSGPRCTALTSHRAAVMDRCPSTTGRAAPRRHERRAPERPRRRWGTPRRHRAPVRRDPPAPF